MARIVKPRTPNQRAAAKRYSKGAPSSLRSTSTTGLPASSWWIGLSRRELRNHQRREQARMSSSKFGRVAIPSYTE
jgi:hypothetical protein